MELHFYLVKVHFYIDIIASEITLVDYLVKYDKSHHNFCTSFSSEKEDLFIIVNYQLDFNDCLYNKWNFEHEWALGIKNMHVDKKAHWTLECDWKENYIDEPIYN